MKSICLLTLLIIFCGCYTTKKSARNYQFDSICQNKSDSIQISKRILGNDYFWRADTFGTTGFRRIYSNCLIVSKVYDVDYEFVIKNLGTGLPQKANKNNLEINYVIFDTDKMSEEWHKYNIRRIITFRFDKKDKMLKDVYISER